MKNECNGERALPAGCSELQKWVDEYSDYLLRVRGLSSNTIRLYSRVALKLMACVWREGRFESTALNADLIAEFVLSEARARKGTGVLTVITAVRSFLRFLVSQGIIHAGINLVIPKLRSYRHKGIPQHLSKKEMELLLKSVGDGTALGKRNFAILQLLCKFGLRAAEVANLELNDVDWRRSEIMIRAGKTHRERKLPLLKSVAEALLDYLRNGRPPGKHQGLFLQHTRPYRIITATSISKLVGRRILRAGLRTNAGGSHILRHSVATGLINKGASFKDIADLLGHCTIESTAVYAKVDLHTLAEIGLPWPGGELK
jgi:site-specific recombinase XerD